MSGSVLLRFIFTHTRLDEEWLFRALFPNGSDVNSATLQNLKHTAHTITWSCFRLEAPTDQTNCKRFRMTGVIGRHGFTWLLPSLVHFFFTSLRTYSKKWGSCRLNQKTPACLLGDSTSASDVGTLHLPAATLNDSQKESISESIAYKISSICYV